MTGYKPATDGTMPTHRLNKLVSIPTAVVALCAAPFAGATSLTIDELLFAVDAGNPNLGSQLAASADMTLSGSVLTLTLKNTTGSSSSSGSSVLLTGIGFNLPTGLSISSGSAAVGSGSTKVGWSSGNLSSEWGFRNGAPGSGHLNGTIGDGVVNATVSTMVADASTKFASGSIDASPGLNGPGFGIISAAGSAGGQNAVRDTIVFTLNLTGTYGGNLIQYIESKDVVVTFASPNAKYIGVPDTGLTLTMLGSALVGIALLKRRRS